MALWNRRKTPQPSSPTETLPPAAQRAIPDSQRGGPVMALDDGRYLLAGDTELFVTDSDRLADSGPYYQVQFAAWNAETRRFRLVWSQPDRPGIEGVTVSDDPSEFMKTLTTNVNDTIVATRKFVTKGGVTVAASVRRKDGGELFSVVVAAGPISAQEEQRGYEMEEALRAELNMG